MAKHNYSEHFCGTKIVLYNSEKKEKKIYDVLITIMSLSDKLTLKSD